MDGGGNSRQSVERYVNKIGNFHKIYVFEPNSFFSKSYENSNFIFINKAIWTKNCFLPFYLSKDERQIASSLLKEKLCKVDSKIVPYFEEEPVLVECVDLSDWIEKNIKTHHRLILKLDIEGAEYDVLNKLIEEKTILKVKKLYVEFHPETVLSKKHDHHLIIEKLKKIGLLVQEWD